MFERVVPGRVFVETMVLDQADAVPPPPVHDRPLQGWNGNYDTSRDPHMESPLTSLRCTNTCQSPSPFTVAFSNHEATQADDFGASHRLSSTASESHSSRSGLAAMDERRRICPALSSPLSPSSPSTTTPILDEGKSFPAASTFAMAVKRAEMHRRVPWPFDTSDGIRRWTVEHSPSCGILLLAFFVSSPTLSSARLGYLTDDASPRLFGFEGVGPRPLPSRRR